MGTQFSDVSTQGVVEWSRRPGDADPALQPGPRFQAAEPPDSGAAGAGRPRAEASRLGGVLQHVWECRIGGWVVGRVGLGHDGPGVARICFFRIDPEWQHTGVAMKLIRRVCDHCAAHGCFEVMWKPGAAPRWLRGLFVRHRVRPARRLAARGRIASRFASDW